MQASGSLRRFVPGEIGASTNQGKYVGQRYEGYKGASTVKMVTKSLLQLNRYRSIDFFEAGRFFVVLCGRDGLEARREQP